MFVVLAWSLWQPAYAILEIEITKGVEKGMPIAVVPFKMPAGPIPHDVSAIITADLARSGRFEPLPEADLLSRPFEARQVRYNEWRLLKAEALVVGKVELRGDGNFQIQFQLLDVFKGTQLAGRRYTVTGRQLRRAAHQISDIIYEKLTGYRGAFDTRIAYVTAETGSGQTRYHLKIADSDGYNPVSILESAEPIMSPAWSPDGTQIAYVSFEDGRSMVFTQNLANETRTRIAAYPGLNSAPVWSPDGQRLALVLSKDGNPELYLYSFDDRRLVRLTRSPAIDTEPSWSPDGRKLVFTSDRSGSPQVYRMSADGGPAQRLTVRLGKYNARPRYAPDGKALVLVHRKAGGYRIAILHLHNLALHVLTDGVLDESPSFAPNGQMLLYASSQAGRGVLAVVTSDGRAQHLLRFQQGAVREPAWSPYSRKF